GADDFISKPWNPAELRARLGVGRRLIGLKDRLAGKLDELERANGKLAESCEELAAKNRELKATQEQLVHAEKLAMAGRLAGGVAHELGNPLAAVKANLGLLCGFG